MNRFTKQISLVLISSSLILHGCEEQPEKDQKKDGNSPASSSGSSHAYHGVGSHYVPVFHSTGSGISSMSGRSSGSISSSSRGGFGSTAHGVSS
jgi:hypothetical protein